MTVSELHERHFHPLETQRLRLRPLVTPDAEAMFAYTSVPESFQYLRRSVHTSVEEDQAFIRDVLEGYRLHREFVWGICPQDMDRPIGTCRLFDLWPAEGRCEVSYLIHPACRHRGIAPEVVERLIHYVFEELDFRTMYARCAIENTDSERVMQKCGMTLEKKLPHYAKLHGIWYDFLLYSIKRKEVPV